MTAAMSYNAQSIQILSGLEPVRRRPGMYIGGTDSAGFHHLLWEILDNAVDEAMNGHATRIDVWLHRDGRSATVADDGRGIPVDLHPEARRPALEVILTTLHSGGKFDGKSYTASGGLHGVGASVVNALSEELTAIVRRDGGEFKQVFRRGRPRADLVRVGDCRAKGTRIQFRPDPEIFGALSFDPELVRERMEVTAFLHRGLRLRLNDEVRGQTYEFHSPGGLRTYVDTLTKRLGRTMLHAEPFCVERKGELRMEVAIGWTDAPREYFTSFANGIPTPGGGTHEQGTRDAIVKAIRTYIEIHQLQPRGMTLTADDIREGVLAITSVFLTEPQFQGQTKDKLNNPEVRAQVDGMVRLALEQFLNANRTIADIVVTRVLQAARARLARTSAEEQVRRKSPTSSRLTLPGKLADCVSSDPRNTELFIVEGDSAGGSAKQGRDRDTQAVLPLRGKVLNTEQATLKKVLENQELNNIVAALGCGIGKDFDRSKLRYQRIILLMDADSDGHHISTLLLTFFYRHLPGLIEGGHLFIAQPPLYRIDVGQRTFWAADDAEKARVIKRLGGREPEITRFKGLGEMPPKVLFDTTLDPRRRRMLRVTLPDGMRAETEKMISELMGRDAAPRFREIMERVNEVETLDV